jgi:hypothetical protein
MNAPNVVGMREVTQVAGKPRAKSPAAAAAGRAEKRALNKANAKEIQAELYSAGALGGIAAVITALSLSHLAHGITIVTGADGWQPWALAWHRSGHGCDSRSRSTSQASSAPLAGSMSGMALQQSEPRRPTQR